MLNLNALDLRSQYAKLYIVIKAIYCGIYNICEAKSYNKGGGITCVYSVLCVMLPSKVKVCV